MGKDEPVASGVRKGEALQGEREKDATSRTPYSEGGHPPFFFFYIYISIPHSGGYYTVYKHNLMKYIKELFDRGEDRMSICRGCEHYKDKTKSCKKCGCFMPAKTKLAKSKCPIGKW